MTLGTEYKSIMPKLTKDEEQLLEASILKEGLREPIIVGIDDNILDGHNRYFICKRNHIKLKGKRLKLESKEAELEWIYKNQLGKRNLNDYDREIYIGKLSKSEKKEVGGDRKSSVQNEHLISEGRTAEKLAKEYKIGVSTVQRAEKFADAIDVLNEVDTETTAKIRSKEIAITKKDIVKLATKPKEEIKEFLTDLKDGKVKSVKHAEVQVKIDNLKKKEVVEVVENYDVVVIDPPWPMQKIEREVAPDQVLFDYPTMTLDEIGKQKLPMEKDCHVFLWTTQKFLPYAFDILKQWNLNYVFTMTWHKNGGFQPFNLPQYNSEFCLYARKGTPVFTTTKNFNTCFSANRTKHSEKPEEFYELVRRVTSGKRIDIFNRRKIEGFDSWGNEA